MSQRDLEIHGQHGHIRNLVDEVRRLIGERNMEGDLAAILRQKLEVLARLIEAHFAFEEAGGYMAELRARRPELGREVEQLLAQHESIRSLLRIAASTFNEPRGFYLSAASEAIDLIELHEVAETEIMQRSYEPRRAH